MAVPVQQDGKGFNVMKLVTLIIMGPIVNSSVIAPMVKSVIVSEVVCACTVRMKVLALCFPSW